MPAEALLSATGITVVMGEKTLLNDVSVVARRGEVLGLIGPNGAGKSTLLSVLSGDLIPFSGSVSICGYDPAQASALELAKSRSVMLQDVSVSLLSWFAMWCPWAGVHGHARTNRRATMR